MSYLSVAVGLVVLVVVERAVYYGAQGLLPLTLISEGADLAQREVARDVWEMLFWLRVIGPLLGAIVGYLLGARGALLAGGVLLPAALFALDAQRVGSEASLLAFQGAHGLIAPALYVVAGGLVESWAGSGESRRPKLWALFCLLLAGVSAGALVGLWLAGLHSGAPQGGFGRLAMVALVGTLLATAIFLQAPAPERTRSGPGSFPAERVAVLCLLAVPAILYWLGYNVTVEGLHDGLGRVIQTEIDPYILLGMVLIILAALAAFGCLLAVLTGARLPGTPVVLAVTFFLGGTGLALRARSSVSSVPVFWTGELMVLLAEIGLSILVAAMSVRVGPRLSCVLVGSYLALVQATSMLGPGILPSGLDGWGLPIAGVVIASGPTVALLRHRLARNLGEAPAAAGS